MGSTANSLAYNTRLINLRLLGFKDYQEYLKSPMWAVIKPLILERDQNNCQRMGCNRRAIVVHHVAYSMNVLIGKLPGLLVSLCNTCHQECELDKKGNKLPHLDARDKTFELVTRLPKIQGNSNRNIGDWFKERITGQEHRVLAKIIKQELLNTPNWKTILKWWEGPYQNLWTAPPIKDREIARYLAITIKHSFPQFKIMGLVKYGPNKQYYKVQVKGPGGIRQVWTKQQVQYFLDKYSDGYRRK